MNSFQRIILASRAAIREMSAWHYLLSSGIVVAIFLFISVIGEGNIAVTGVLYDRYNIIETETLIGIIVSAGWISATIICGSVFFKNFKEEDRGVSYFSLPLANKERFASLLLVNWGFISLISFGPPILFAALSWWIAPEYLLLPQPQYLLPALLIGPLVHLISCSYWMFSSIAYPKLSAVFIFGFIGLVVLYASQTRNLYSDRIDIEHTAAAFNTTDVVGMMEYNFLSEEATPSQISYYLMDWDTPALILGGICFAFMLATAAMALERKTT